LKHGQSNKEGKTNVSLTHMWNQSN